LKNRRGAAGYLWLLGLSRLGEIMTEAEWLASEDPAVMGEAVLKKKRATARVLRLYLAAFWDWQSHRLETDEGRKQLKERAAVVTQWAETGKPTGEGAKKNTGLVFFNRSAAEGFLSTVRARPAGRRANQR
jgi:hypothetical protein